MFKEVGVRAARLRGYWESDPGNVELACELVDELLAEGQVDEAELVLESAVKSAGLSEAMRFRQCRIALLRGDYAVAEHHLQELLQGGQDGLSLRHDLAFAQLCQRRPQQALETLLPTRGHWAAVPELGVLHARVLLMCEDYDGAVEALDVVLATHPQAASAMGVKALALLDGDRLLEARVAADACLALYPEQHEALLVSGTLSLWRQDTAAASAAYRATLQRHPNSGRVLSGYGQVLMSQNRVDDARPVFEAAVKAMPDHIGTWHALAWAQLLQGDQLAAEASYHAAYDLDRNFGDTHGGLALIAALRGDEAKAEQEIKRALRLDPNAMTARYAEALIRESRGDQEGSNAIIADIVHAAGSRMQASEFARRLKTLLNAHTA
ncbi:tetratricopeptide repeat protein [Solilutibacter pythonis]|uniref:tetratricopeptide repeat protein n=1 Tax=Solilutibacter pythonis TaxID=2483112 RepID=UPI001314D52A|nr:tetratricopeptide repeat protein [Lysobacter pythonis]